MLELRIGWMGDMFLAGEFLVQGRLTVFEITKVFYNKDKCKQFIKDHNERISDTKEDN